MARGVVSLRRSLMTGAIRRHLRTQGHRLRVRLVDFGRVQALSNQGVSAAQGRRTQTARLGHQTQLGEDQLPHPYRRYQRESDPARIVEGTDQSGLCERGGCSEHGLVRRDREAVAGRKPRRERQLSNLESLNAVLIADGLPQAERLDRLNKTAIGQMKLLVDDLGVKKLGRKK